MKIIESMNDIKNIGLFLARPKSVFYTLIWLIVLLFVGTIAQKYIGLYQAQNMFFSSWFFMWGPVPLPGGLPTLGFLTICLIAKLFITSKWSWNNSGTIVTHIGALLLLIGGLVTFVSSKEGSMTIYEGGTSNYFLDYHIRELAIEDKETGAKIDAFAWDELEKGKVFSIPNTSVNIEIVNLCKNCNVFPRKEGAVLDPELRGMAQRMDISPIKLEKNDEENRGAVQFRISGAGEEKNGIHFSTDFIEVSPWVEVGGKEYNIALRRKKTVLPFEIELIDFEKKMHPGTDKPKSYKSEIILHENGSEWRSVVQMNDPLRYRGYTFFQSSFIERGDTEATVFAVVKNAGRTFPYIASIVMCIGLLIHVFLRMPKLMKKSHKALLVVGLMGATMFSAPQSGHAKTVEYSFEKFAQIPILDQGRVKPLDTFARTYLEMINGKEGLPDRSAIEWLAETIFNPERAYRREVFNIPNPKVVDALELEKRKGHRYSYVEISTAFYTHSKTWHSLFTIPEEDMSLQQKQLLELFTKTQIFADVSRSLSLLFNEFTVPEGKLAEELGVDPGSNVNFLKLRSHQELVKTLSEELDAESEKKDYKVSGGDILLKRVVLNIEEMNRDRNSFIFKVIPPQWKKSAEGNAHSERWFSPWGIGLYGQGSPDSVKFLGLWSELVEAYKSGDSAHWDKLVLQVHASSFEMAEESTLGALIALEVKFNHAKPFNISFVFFLLSFMAVMAGFIIWPKQLLKISFGLLIAGLVSHLIGTGIRMYIMQRPPVTNLYESVIFVSLVVGIFGAIIERRLKNGIGIIVATSMGIILHFIGMKFDAEGDTMGMLVAVLDTNFWLATHVVTITIGYGCCFVGGVMGHIYLIQRFFGFRGDKQLSELAKNMRGVVFVALLFATIGTILGGIWADQSWGRFWGWDPKENGALLIVLWLLLVIHGRISGVVNDVVFAACMVCTNIVVAIAWFGVNLLSVGLHSYGFTEGAAFVFFVFCALELIFALSFYLLINNKDKKIVKKPAKKSPAKKTAKKVAKKAAKKPVRKVSKKKDKK